MWDGVDWCDGATRLEVAGSFVRSPRYRGGHILLFRVFLNSGLEARWGTAGLRALRVFAHGGQPREAHHVLDGSKVHPLVHGYDLLSPPADGEALGPSFLRLVPLDVGTANAFACGPS